MLQGYAAAAYDLAVCLLTGAGVPRDAEEGLRWLRAAAEGGSLDGAHRLGLALAEGGDIACGRRWIARAAEGGHAGARALAAMHDRRASCAVM